MITKQYEMIITFLVAISIMAGILFGTGTIFSGWHLVDDHETVRMAELDVKAGTEFSEVLLRSLKQDIQHRWRPLYQIFRVAEVYLFGLNSVLPNCLLCIMGIFTYVLLYYSVRNIGINMLCAHLFVNVVILGRQFEIWYRIANQENLGLLFLAICLWLITSQFKNHSYSMKRYNVLLTIFAIACAMMKESFLIILPGIILLRIGLEIASDKKKVSVIVKKNWVMCSLTFVVFIFSVIIILKYVGTDSIGYAGVDMNSGIKEMIWKLMRMCNNALKIYLIVAIMCCILLILSWKNIFILSRNKQIIMGIFLVFSLYVIAGEMVLHAKSDMWDRYLVPFSVGYGLFLIIGAESLLKNKYVKIIYFVVLILFLGTRLYLSIFNRAASYADEGKETQKMLSYIVEHTSPDSKIVTSLGGGEADMAASIYLEFRDRTNVYMYEEDADIWHDIYNIYSDTGELRPDDKCDIYLLSGRRDNEMIEEKILTGSTWKKVQFGKWFDVWTSDDGGKNEYNEY